MASTQIAALYIILCFIPFTISWLYVTFYDLPQYAGYFINCNNTDFDANDMCRLTKDNKYQSILLNIGTCVEINDLNESFWIMDNTMDLGHSFKGGYAKKCDTYNKSLHCPDGFFIKQIEWDKTFDLTKGIKLSCYRPEFFRSNAIILESHPGEEFMDSDARKCPAIYGITFVIDEQKDANVELDLKQNCTAGYRLGIRASCPDHTALSGMDFIIEERSNYIKNSTLICTEVPDIASTCKAEDEKQTLLTYDGTGTSAVYTLNVEKKFGVGATLAMSEWNKNEFDFYSVSGFVIGQSISALSTNFKTTLGISNGTKFDWSSPDNIWQEEQTVNIKIQTKPGCKTEVTEIVGRCSFMDVRLTEYLQVDNCDGRSTETPQVIPDNIVKTFSKEIHDFATNKSVEVVKTKPHGVIKHKAIEVVAKPKHFEVNKQMYEKMGKFLTKIGL